MANYVSGSVSVLVKPVLKGWHGDLRKQLSGGGLEAVGRDISEEILNPVKKALPKALPKDALVKQARDLGDSVGQSIGRGIQGASSFVTTNLTRVVKGAALAAGAAVVGIMGYSLKKGWDRLVAIDDARAKLTGLGHDAKTVQQVMDDALAAVKGTAFGLGDASSVAATLVAAGIEPGKELEKTLSLVGDTATIAGMDLESMGLIWSSVMSRGKLQGDDAMQLMSAGIPVYQMVADHLGITSAEAQKLGEQGLITADIFQAAMEGGVGGAAQAAGNTVSGAIKNMGAAFGRFGAQILEGIFPYISPALTAITEKVDELAAHVAPLAAAFSEKLVEGIKQFIAGFKSSEDGLDGWAAKGQKVREIMEAIGNAAIWVWDHGLKQLVGFIANNFVPIMTAVIGVATTVGLMFSNGILAKGIVAIGSLITGAFSAGGAGGVLGAFFKGIIDGLRKVAPLFDKFVKYLPTLGKWLSKAKIFLNPWVAGIALVVGAIALFMTKTEAGRQITSEVVEYMKKAWGGLTDAFTVVADKVSEFFSLFKEYSQKFVDWFQENMVGPLQEAWGKISDAILGFWNNGIKPAFAILADSFRNIGETIMNFVSKYLPGLGEGGMSMSEMFEAAFEKIKVAVSAVVGFFTEYVVPVIVKVFEYLSGAVKIAATAIGKYLELIVAFLFNVVLPAVIWVFQTILIPLFWVIVDVVKVAIGIVIAIIQGLVWFWQNVLQPAAMWLWHNVIVPVFNGIVSAVRIAIGVVTAIINGLVWFWQNVLSPVLTWLWGVFKTVWDGIMIAVAVVVTAVLVYIDLLKWYFNNVIAPVAIWLWKNVFVPVWNGIKAAIGAVVAWFRDTAWPILSAVINWIRTKFEQFKLGLSIIWNAIKNNVINPVVTWFQNTAWPLISGVINKLKAGFQSMKDRLKVIWDAVRNNVINPIVSWFQNTAWPLISGVIEKLKAGFQSMKDRLKTIWDGVKNNAIAPVANWLSDTLQPKIEGVTDNIKKAFDVMKDGVKKAWDGIKSAARTPAEFVVEDVYDKTIKETFNGVAEKLGIKTRLPNAKLGFATGGVLPGYTPGRDVHQFYSPTGGRLDLSGGEAIMRPEFTRAVGGAAGVAELNRRARRGEAFAGGGVWGKIKGVSGDAWDWLTDKASTVAEALSDPLGVLTKLASKAVGLVPGGGMVRELVQKAGTNAAEQGGQWLKDQLFNSEVGAGSVPQAGAGSGGWGKASNAAAALGLRMTSATRRGARTAGSGSVSMHALGRARDYAGSASAMRAFFNAMDSAPYPTELLYSPMGARNIHRGGRRYANTGATKRNHYDHVHVAFKDGGIMPELHDKGGVLQPGLSLISNQSRKPEAILSDSQWQTAHAAMSRQADSRTTTINQYIRDTDATANRIADEVSWGLRRAEIRGRF